jgi:uncharacterized protein
MGKVVSIKAVARAAKTADASLRKATTDSFQNFEQNLGIGTNNSTSAASYGFNPITRIRTLLEWMHRGSWIAGMAIDIIADDMTRMGATIDAQLKPEENEQIEETALALDVWGKLNEAIKWGRLYGGAVAVLMIEGQNLATPLRLDTVRKGQFQGLYVLDRWMIDPSLGDLVQDIGPALGTPKYYTVFSNAPALRGQRIHYTRLIRFLGIRLPYQQQIMENLWSESILERLYDRMIGFDTANAGAAQLIGKSYLRTLKIEDLRSQILAGGPALAGLTKYVAMMTRFQGIEGMSMIDAKDDLEANTHGAFSGISDVMLQFGQQLSGALQIPLVRLFGQSPAGLNSSGDSDLKTDDDGIRQRQVRDMGVGVTSIYRCIAASEGINVKDGLKVRFNSLWQMTDVEKADVAAKNTETVVSAYDAGLISQQIALKELRNASHTTGIFTTIEDDDIDSADDEIPDPQEALEMAQAGAGETGGVPKPPAASGGSGGAESEGVKGQGQSGTTKPKEKADAKAKKD